MTVVSRESTRRLLRSYLPAWLQSAFHGIGALALPADCLLCREPLECPLRGPVCECCLASLPWIREPFCPRCGLPYFPGVASGLCGPCRTAERRFRRARAALPYVPEVRLCLHALKYGGRHVLASVLGALASERFLVSGELGDPAAVVPVPLSSKRRRERGFNQAELIARAVAGAAGIPMRARILRKTEERPPQAGLSARARKANARGAYRALLPVSLRGRDLLLVDDVFTTGATVEAGARALLRAGAGSVDVLTLARVP